MLWQVGDHLDGQAGRFLDYLQVERGLSPNTLEAYRRDLRRYAVYLRGNGFDDATQVGEDQVSGFVGWLSARPFAEGRRYRASSVARSLAAVRMFHRFLLREGEARADAADGVARPKVPRTLPRPLSVGDVELLLASAAPRTSPGSGTARSSRPSTAQGCGSPSWSGWTWTRSTWTRGACGCSARGERSASCRSGASRSRRSPRT